MNAFLRAGVGLACLAATTVGANATTFYWSYSGTNGYGVTASGTLDATWVSSVAYQVTAIHGTRNGVAIAGLTNYALQDDMIFTMGIGLDYFGLAFEDINGHAFNIFYDTQTVDPYACGYVGFCEIGPGVPGADGITPTPDARGPIVFSFSPVPEPATWTVVLAAGLLAGFGVRQRGRARK